MTATQRTGPLMSDGRSAVGTVPTPNVTLYNLRDAHGLTQEELAERLQALAHSQGHSIGLEAVTVSRWERGIIGRPAPLYRRLLAEFFGVSIAELGMTRPRTRTEVLQ